MFSYRRSTPHAEESTQHAYIARSWFSSWDRQMRYRLVPFDGIALERDVQVAEAVRIGAQKTFSFREHSGWGVSSIDEFSDNPDIYQVPLNRMENVEKAQLIYGQRLVTKPSMSVWGPIGEEVSRAEIDAIADRNEYRRTHMDAEDPLKAVLKKQLANLPKPLTKAKAPKVYIALDRRRFRRELGVFTSYQSALEVAPKQAEIHELIANGHDAQNTAHLVRGHFRGGWGYASGYALNEHPSNLA